MGSYWEGVTTLVCDIVETCSVPGAGPGLVVRGALVGEGSGDCLRSPAGARQSPGRGPRGANPPPPPEALGI